jgi:mannosyltransferase
VLPHGRATWANVAWAVGLAMIAATLRFATLRVQSFGDDELYTVWLTRMGLGDMLRTIPESESTPPLYYLLVWGWAQVFGTGEIGLRSLSALLGTATVVVAWQAARVLVSLRAALFVAALVAVHPLFVWFSQEARSYALLLPLTGLTLWLFARALRRTSAKALTWWGLVSALAVGTHYFALFLIIPEAVWLIAVARPRRWAFWAAGLPAAAAAALIPLAVHQRSIGNPEFIATSTSLVLRVAQIPKNFLVGFSNPAELPVTLAAAGLAVLSLLLLITNGSPRDRRGAAIAGGVAAFAVGAPILLALVGHDYVATRNLLGALVPSVVVVGAGFASSRLGLVAGAFACVLSVGIVASVAGDPASQRRDWRAAARALGPAQRPRAIVVSPWIDSRVWVYVPAARPLPSTGALLGEVVVVGMARLNVYGFHRPRPPRLAVRRSPPGFVLVERREAATYTLLRFRSAAARRVSPALLTSLSLFPGEEPAVLFQSARE